MHIAQPYVDVGAKSQQLGCQRPTGLAVLPRNFEIATRREEFVHDATGLSVRAAWRAEGIDETRIEPPGELWPAQQQDSAGWVGPLIFVGGSLLSQNPALISIAFGIIANYATDTLRGLPPGKQTASLSVAVETRDGESCRIDYTGPPDGITELPDVIRALRD